MSIHGSFNKLHRVRNLAARYSPTIPGQSILSSSTSDPAGGQKTSAALTSPSTPTILSTPTSAQLSTTSPTSTSSSSSDSVPSSSAISSSSSSTSSSTTTTSSSTSSSLVPQTPASTTSPPVVIVHSTSFATGVTLAPSSTTSAAPSSTPNSSGSINTTAVIGGIAGSLVGLAVLGFLVMWCIRRRRKNDEDEDWSAAAFKRQSAILVDDPLEPQPSYTPRPPTMIERHNASPALAVQRNYPQNIYGAYGQQAAYGPGEVTRGNSPPMQPHGYAPREDPSQLARQPSSTAYLSRQPTAAGYDIPNDPYAHYVDLNRSSVTPFQAAQYADLSRQLGGDPNSAVAPRESMDAARLPSPFDEDANLLDDTAPRAPSPVHISGSPAVDSTTASVPGPAPVPRGREITNPKRPDTVYTMYEEGDAYDGF